MLTLPSPPYAIEFINECDPADTGRPDSMIYERYYTLNTQNFSGCRFGIRVKLGSDLQASCLVMSNGAMFKIDGDSVIVYSQLCVLAVGPHVAAYPFPHWTSFGHAKSRGLELWESTTYLQLIPLWSTARPRWRGFRWKVNCSGITLRQICLRMDSKYEKAMSMRSTGKIESTGSIWSWGKIVRLRGSHGYVASASAKCG